MDEISAKETLASEEIAAYGGERADSEPPAPAPASLSQRVHDWIPMGIVIVSVLAALMGWRASLAEESAATHDEVGGQDIVLQQQTLLQKLQTVDSDVRLFGTYEQYSLLGKAMLAQARTTPGPEGQTLARQGQADVELARALAGQFQAASFNPADAGNYYDSSNNPYGVLAPDGTLQPGARPYDVHSALISQQSGVQQLIGTEPDRLDRQASADRSRGVKLIGLAALFIAALVFLTFGAVSRGRRTIGFAASGVLVALVALILFGVLLLS